MKKLIYLLITIVFVSQNITCQNNMKEFTEKDVLNELDAPFKTPLSVKKLDEKTYFYNFFLDLENAYLNVANSIIHLYADESKWAIVFEINGYHNKSYNAQIDLLYFGNCIKYDKKETPERVNLSNLFTIELISGEEFTKVENKTGSDLEQFELISDNADSIQIRDKKVRIEKDKTKYEEKLIVFREYENPNNLAGFEDLVRYLSVSEKDMMCASENEIEEHLLDDLPKIMTIESFHYHSIYNKGNLPSKQETFQLIAKILVSKDPNLWKPTLEPNNHWSNWESGNL